jgi:hypothetical protein
MPAALGKIGKVVDVEPPGKLYVEFDQLRIHMRCLFTGRCCLLASGRPRAGAAFNCHG